LKIISTIQKFRKWRKDISGVIGFIPTMGALHDGHLSLVLASKKSCQITVVSIYLNPAQFAPHEDLDSYPKSVDTDLKKIEKLQVDCVFLPNDFEIYPNGFSTQVKENILSNVLEGKSRPRFFSGITTVIAKLFNIIQPTHAFFGEKDAQQLRVVKKMVKDLNYPIKIISGSIIREKNGVAMSSRNQYLSEKEKEIAAIIHQALQDGKNLIFSGERDANKIRDKITHKIKSEKLLRIDYISIVDNDTFIEISGEISRDILVSTAVFLGKTRLIDNFTYSDSSNK